MLKHRSFRLALLLVLATLASLSSNAQPAAGRAPAARLVEFKLTAPALKNNLLGDPAEQSVAVYLPPSYYASPATRFPTLYLLHGFTGNIKAWTTSGYQGMNLKDLMDDMVKSGKSREMIVVVPNGANSYGGAFYANSSVTGNWEDYIVRDLVGYVDSHYHTLARAESRGIAGHSMGGYGALVLGMKHPDVFSSVYALSPCCLGMAGDLSEENKAWKKTLNLKSKAQLSAKPQSLADFYSVAFVAIGASFSPNPERAPFYADFPFLERNGHIEKNEVVYQLWRSKMPLYLVDENKQNLRKLRGIFIDYGENEEFSHIRITTNLFSKALAEQNIPHAFEVYPVGDHGSKIRERLETRVLQFFSEKLDFSNSK